ncbi:ABC transporter transmembrane domain-containing protein [Corynebacterium sp. H128]|uniref:ABC transporter ATP-binding protein/permease n=1 Tax=unclassified Corynebacterium TaxID=2624378 RepID=UPI0030B4958C
MTSPLNKRLLAAAPAARRHLLISGIAQATQTMLIVARAVLIGVLAATLIEDHTAKWGLLWVLLAVVIAQAVTAYAAKRWASHSIGTAVDQLREAALTTLSRRDPREVEADAAQWRTTLTEGLSGVRPYLSDYVPALVASCISTPLALAVMLYFDLPSGILAAATIPLIPLFMVLIGTLTRSHTQRRLRVASALSGQLADLLQGAPTLRALGATKAPHEQLIRTGRSHADATMSVLKLAFLSAFALEFLATLSVALVAVGIGLRLVAGDMTLLAGLVALIIAPEVYGPLRQVGASFHAASDGMSAAEQVFDLLDSDEELTAHYRTVQDAGVSVHDLSVSGRDGVRPQHLTFNAQPGEITVLRGANGSGKSTALLAILGMLPDRSLSGEISAPDLQDIAFLPAHPAFIGGTVADNLELFGSPPDTRAQVAFGFEVPLAQRVLPNGAGISAGQGQRLALARSVSDSEKSTLLFDEPSAHLSPEYVELLGAELRRQAQAGKTLVICSHDDRLAKLADQVIDL